MGDMGGVAAVRLPRRIEGDYGWDYYWVVETRNGPCYAENWFAALWLGIRVAWWDQ